MGGKRMPEKPVRRNLFARELWEPKYRPKRVPPCKGHDKYSERETEEGYGDEEYYP